MKKYSRFMLILIAGALPAFGCFAESSEIFIAHRLYQDGRADQDEQGTVKELAAWRNCLYVSYAKFSGDYFLHVWDITHSESPRFVEEHYKGNVSDDEGANIPVAHLKSPRDMQVLDSHLIFWSMYKAEVYRLREDCSLDPQNKGFQFSNGLSAHMNRLTYGGQMAATQFHEQSGRSYYGVLNLQNPTKPFLQAGPELSSGITGTYKGLPAITGISADRSTLSLRSYSQERREHVSGFWIETVLGEIFDLTKSNQTLRKIARESLTDQFLRSEQGRLFDVLLNSEESFRSHARSGKKLTKKMKRKLKRLRKRVRELKQALRSVRAPSKKAKARKRSRIKKKLQLLRERVAELRSGGDGSADGDEYPNQPPQVDLPASATLDRVIRTTFEGGDELREVISLYRVDPHDSVQLAVQKIVEANISDRVEEVLRHNISADVLPLLAQSVFSLSSMPLAELRDHLTSRLNSKLSSAGVVSYLLQDLFSPLMGHPAIMNKSLHDLLSAATDNEAAHVVDTTLTVAKTLMPSQIILDLLGYEPPACLRVPGTLREVLDMAFIDGGPELNPNGPAFWEIMKAVQFYHGQTNFSNYEDDLNEHLRDFHRELIEEVLRQTQSFIGESAELSGNLEAAFASYGSDLSPLSVVSELISNVVIRDLESELGGGLAEQQLAAFLADYGVYISLEIVPAGKSLSTVNDLRTFLRRTPLSERSVRSLVQAASGSDLATIRESFENSFNQALGQLFGKDSLDTTLSDAAHSFLIGRMDPSLFGTLTRDLLSDALEGITGSPLSSVTGVYGLAAQGDCISQWIVALKAVAAAVAGTPNAIAIEAANGFIQAAYDAGVKFALKFVFQQLVNEIFSGHGGNYASWYTAVESHLHVLDVSNYGAWGSRLADTFSYRDTVAVVLRDVGFLGAIPGDDTRVSVLLADPYNADESARMVELGNWHSVTMLQQHEDYIVVAGERILADGDREHAVTILHFTSPASDSYSLFGSHAILFSGGAEVDVVRNGQGLALRTAGGEVVLVELR